MRALPTTRLARTVGALAATAFALTPATAHALTIPPVLGSPPPPSSNPPSTSTPQPSTPPLIKGTAPVSPSSAQVGTTTARANGQRTNSVDDPSLVPPLEKRWARTLADEIEQAIYGDGLVYVRMNHALMALNPATGATVWSATDFVVGPVSFGNGVLVENGFGTLVAREARTGRILWNTNADGTEYGPAVSPLIIGNVVYAGSTRRLSAFSLSDGAVLWQSNAVVGGYLMTDGTRLFGSPDCSGVSAFSAATGAGVWQQPGSCDPGGTDAMVHGGNLYGLQGKTIIDAATGAPRGTFRDHVRAMAGGVGVFSKNDNPHFSDDRLVGVQLGSQRQLWQTRKLGATPSGLLVVGHSIYTTSSSSQMLVHSLETGAREQTIMVPDGSPSGIDRAPAAAPGTLLVPGDDRLVAYQSVYRPAPAGIDASVPLAAVEFGKRAIVDGVLGAALRGGTRRVTGQLAPFRRKRFRSAGSVKAGPDGFFSATVTASRNTRLRMTSGPARSKVLHVYVYPRFRNTLKRSRANVNRIRASVRVAVPRGVRLGGRRVVLYEGQPGRRRYLRLGTARLRAAGRGKGRATVRFNALRSVGKRDFLLFCIPHSSRLGLGRADVVDRRCGRRRLPLR